MLAIYRHPSDYPNQWVARWWTVRSPFGGVPSVIPDLEPFGIADSYDEILGFVPRGMTSMGRSPSDDPGIFEVYL